MYIFRFNWKNIYIRNQIIKFLSKLCDVWKKHKKAKLFDLKESRRKKISKIYRKFGTYLDNMTF